MQTDATLLANNNQQCWELLALVASVCMGLKLSDHKCLLTYNESYNFPILAKINQHQNEFFQYFTPRPRYEFVLQEGVSGGGLSFRGSVMRLPGEKTRDICAENGANLVKFTSASENDFVLYLSNKFAPQRQQM